MKNKIAFLLVCLLSAAWLSFLMTPGNFVFATTNTTATSKLGRILSPDAIIYQTIGSTSGTFQAGTQYTDKVFYIKKQAVLNGQTYYLISTVASDTKGVIGWVHAQDMWAQTHTAVDHNDKLFYLKGTGWAYTDPWGAGKDAIYRDLTPFQFQTFKVNLTEKVGSAIWYRGYLENGQKVWIQAYNVTVEKPTITFTATSKLGRILSPDAIIYQTIGSTSGTFQAGTQYTDKVFYIKKQAVLNGQTYYLISTVASDTKGVIGWVHAQDMWAQTHTAVDHNDKLFYLKGTGWAYTDPWGAGKDAIYRDLTPFQFQTFKVNLTEKVGSAIWYRGYLENGQKVWIQA
ncbi:mannosyl-glycoprotein endo-beta-N-acetylglucosamidase, partial [Geobacillus sp. LEMMJ02]|uniref:GW dipeptide domain-containing protein n=1 Tax=Geobacillus sp. LEMMJ02 TaxID=2595057 RepID=UPI0011971967